MLPSWVVEEAAAEAIGSSHTASAAITAATSGQRRRGSHARPAITVAGEAAVAEPEEIGQRELPPWARRRPLRYRSDDIRCA